MNLYSEAQANLLSSNIIKSDNRFKNDFTQHYRPVFEKMCATFQKT